ncbi:MAG: hypothetical protein ABFE01_26570 [Phycisphaerales bacterium]
MPIHGGDYLGGEGGCLLAHAILEQLDDAVEQFEMFASGFIDFALEQLAADHIDSTSFARSRNDPRRRRRLQIHTTIIPDFGEENLA